MKMNQIIASLIIAILLQGCVGFGPTEITLPNGVTFQKPKGWILNKKSKHQYDFSGFPTSKTMGSALEC